MTSKGDLLRSKVCVVTGGGRGIGAAIAVRFAEEGACLILTARSEDQLEQTAKICRTRGATSCDTYSVDLAQRALVTKFATDVLSKFKKVDVLVNNAGTNLAGHFGLEGDSAEWEEALMLNTLAPMILTKCFSEGMKERREGIIINIGSIAGIAPFPAAPVYSATKWALRGWSLGCYEILRHHDVKVVLINPGAVDTPIIKGPLVDMIDRKKCLTTDDIAQAAMLSLTLAPQSVPMEMTLDTTQSALIAFQAANDAFKS